MIEREKEIKRKEAHNKYSEKEREKEERGIMIEREKERKMKIWKVRNIQRVK